jgi:hypothetical protein
MQTFLRAADGIRTHDLLHGKQNVWSRLRADFRLQMREFSDPAVVLRFPGFHPVQGARRRR